MRAVIDTNVWVSAVLNPHGAPAQVFEAFRQARFLAIQSQPLMDELREVIARPRLMRRLAYNMQMIQELIELISARAIWVEVRGEVSVCRDPHDNMVLETALLGRAEYLVTRDDDLKRDPDLIQKMAEQGVQEIMRFKWRAKRRATSSSGALRCSYGSVSSPTFFMDFWETIASIR
jgi:putative PIN family toxin of toxin-antitoxin system